MFCLVRHVHSLTSLQSNFIYIPRIHPPFCRAPFKGQSPRSRKSLTLIQQLTKKKEQGESGFIRYNLADSIYARAELDYTEGIVYLWLGANVMLEYTYEEAIEFLTRNKERAESELTAVESDLAFVRDQIVTCEVLRSRIYNWDVRRRRKLNVAETSSN